MKELTFPASVPELRDLHAESKAFKTRDVPPKQQEMNRLLRLYQDLEVSEGRHDDVIMTSVMASHWYLAEAQRTCPVVSCRRDALATASIEETWM